MGGLYNKMVGFLFAGQGSQYVGMGKDLYETFPESKAVFDRADKVLGFSLTQHCFEGPQELLKTTNVSQPAIVTVSLAAFEAFKARSALKPKFAAGLSLGEYTALIASGALLFEDGLRLVSKRGRIMDEAARKHPGKMAAVLELPFEKLKDICSRSGAEIANLNAPGQVVISGSIDAINKSKELCLEAGAKRFIELEVSGAFHSSLMFEASVELKNVLDNTSMHPPAISVVSNYTALPQYKVVQISENLVKQMRSSVRWEDSMRYMLSQGVTDFFEFGPGKVLKGLMRKIDANARVTSVEKKDDVDKSVSV